MVTLGTQDEEKQNKNTEKLVTLGTQDEEKQNKNTEKLVTLGTQDEEKQNKNVYFRLPLRYSLSIYYSRPVDSLSCAN
jgi:hypothetical protein